EPVGPDAVDPARAPALDGRARWLGRAHLLARRVRRGAEPGRVPRLQGGPDPSDAAPGTGARAEDPRQRRGSGRGSDPTGRGAAEGARGRGRGGHPDGQDRRARGHRQGRRVPRERRGRELDHRRDPGHRRRTALGDRQVTTALELGPLTAWMRGRGLEINGELTARRVGRGHSNLTYRLEDADGRAWIARRPPLGELLASAHDVVREFRILDALGDTEVPVPTM